MWCKFFHIGTKEFGMRVCGVFLSVLLMFYPDHTPFAQQPAESYFFELQDGIGYLYDLQDQGEQIDLDALNRLDTAANELQNILAAPTVVLPTEYRTSLEAIGNIVAEIPHIPDISDRNDAISEIASDLEIKIDFVRTKMQFFDADLLVKVNVTTRQGTSVVNGFTVRANPVRYRSLEPLFLFDAPTSPSEKMLPPGRYEITVRQADVIAKQDFEVGLTGEKQQSFTIMLPDNSAAQR